MTDDSVTRDPMAALQADVPAVLPNSLTEVLQVLKPLLSKHGMSVIQGIGHLENGHIVLETRFEGAGQDWITQVRLGVSLEDTRLESLALALGFVTDDVPTPGALVTETVGEPVAPIQGAVPAEVWLHLAEEMKHKIELITTRRALDDWHAANKTVIDIMRGAPNGKSAHALVEETFKAKWRETHA